MTRKRESPDGSEGTDGFFNKQTITAILLSMGLSGGGGVVASNRITVARMDAGGETHMTYSDFSTRIALESPWLRDRERVMSVVEDVRTLRDQIGDVREAQSGISAKLDILLAQQGLASK